MGFAERFRSLKRDVKGVQELDQYESGGYDSLDEIEEDMHDEWETYKQEHNLDDLGQLDGTFNVEMNGGFLQAESLSVKSADYLIQFEEYQPKEDSADTLFKAEYLTYNNGVEESEDVPAFFRGFLEDNFEPVDNL